MDNQQFLAAGGHIPGGDGGTGEAGLGHFTFSQGRIDVSEAAPGLVYVQEASGIGVLGLNGIVTVDHVRIAIKAVGKALLGNLGAALIPA